MTAKKVIIRLNSQLHYQLVALHILLFQICNRYHQSLTNCDRGTLSTIALVNCASCLVECVIMGHVSRYVPGFGLLVIHYFTSSYHATRYVVDCSGRKEVSCPRCNPNKDLDSCVHGVTTECSKCHGRGLLAHQDGSDTKLVFTQEFVFFCLATRSIGAEHK